MATWRGWWVVNDRALLPGRVDSYGTTTPTPDAEAIARGRLHKREAAVAREILPALRRLLAPDAHVNDLLRRTGLIALGKVARTEEDVALLVQWLTDARADTPVRESAALGLGLLRRSEEARQFDARVLDAVRQRLIKVSDDARAADEIRATCLLSVGLLGDQPFGAGIHRDGRLVTRVLWRGLEEKHARLDLPVARLTALGMQPPAGVPDAVREGLREAVYGRSVQGRRWEDSERGHALLAIARLGGPGALTTPRQVLLLRRAPDELRRAAFIALGHVASDLDPRGRMEAAGVLREAIRRANDPLSQGLAWIAVGRLVSAQIGAGDPLVRDLQTLWSQLFASTRSGSVTVRGFAALAVGLAVRPPASEDTLPRPLQRARREAEALLLEGFEKGRGDDDLRGAYATALGLMRARSAVPLLVETVGTRSAADALRSDAAIALGSIGYSGTNVVRVLQLALSERKRHRVQSGAALALSLLRGPQAGARLLRELEHATSNTDVLRLTEPLGHLGDPTLARPLVEYALSTRNADYPRASMLVALGNLGDPERKPSLARFGEDANYPSATPTLLGVLTTR